MNTQVILTAIGSDRPGLTQALANAVLKAGGNWLESHLSHLAGKFVGAVLVEVPEEKLAALEAALRAVDAAGLTVTSVRAPAGAAPAPGRRVALEVVGQDRPGIVREVTAVLAARGVNIEDLETEVASASWSGERLFRAKATLRLADTITPGALRDALERISGEVMVDIALSEVAP